MNIEKYNKAKELLERIDHLEKMLVFLNTINNKGTGILMRETGFLSHPLEERLEYCELPCIIEAFEHEKSRLNQEFCKL